MENTKEIAKNFVEKCENRANANETIKTGADWKETANTLDNILRGYNATAKIVIGYICTASDDEKANKKSFFNHFSLGSIEPEKGKIHSFICENLPHRVFQGRLTAPVKCSDLADLRKQAAAILDELQKAGKSAPVSVRDEVKAMKIQLAAIEADHDKTAADALRVKIETLSKDWRKVLETRYNETIKTANETAAEIEKAVIEAGFIPWADKNGTFVGAFAPIVKFSPKGLAELIRLAAIEADKKAKENEK